MEPGSLGEMFLGIYLGIAIVCIMSCVILHSFVIVRTLRKHGHGIFTGLSSLKFFYELEEYKKICINENKPLFWYKLVKTLCAVFAIMALLGILFMIGMALTFSG